MTSSARPTRIELWSWLRDGQRLLVIAALLLVVAAAVAGLALVQGIDRQVDDVLHTHDVRDRAREVMASLREVEDSHNRSALAGQVHDPSAYVQATAGMNRLLLSLTALTQNDPEQSRQVRSIADQISIRIAAIEQAQTGSDARQMEDMRVLLEEFIGAENQKLLERNGEIAQSRRWLIGSIIVALLGALLLGARLLVVTHRQVSVLARTTDRLLTENELLEAHVQDRTQALEDARQHAERERQRVESLLQDANHRIGNSLATVSSLLGLQLMRSTSDEVRTALEAAQSRVHSIASAHRRLRLGDDLETASADELLEAVLDDIAATASDAKNIRLMGAFAPVIVPARDATTLGILVGELVTNAVKHAFPAGRIGTIRVSLVRDAAGVPTLEVLDDGVGLASAHSPGDGGLGSVIVRQLAAQFGGEARYERPVGGGLSVTITMPALKDIKSTDGR